MLKRLLSWLMTQTGEQSARITGTGDYGFDIVGEGSYQEALEELCPRSESSADLRCEAVLSFDLNNAHDRNAVVVCIGGLIVGYLSRKDAREFGRQARSLGFGDFSFICDAKIVGGWMRPRELGHFGVKLDLQWPLTIVR